MSAESAVLVHEGPGGSPAWAGSLGPLRRVGLAPAPSSEAREALRDAECALVDGEAADPLRLARRIHSVDPSLQVVVVAPRETLARLRQAVLLTPGIGEVWLVGPDGVDRDTLERAQAVTRQRRSYRSTRTRIEQHLGRAEPLRVQRAQISDTFLAALLQAVPDPVLSVDERGHVLSWNPAAERVLGYAAHEMIGRPLTEIAADHDRGTLQGLLEEAPAGRKTREVRFRRKGGQEGIGEVIVTPAEAAGHGILSVILHDVTEQRWTQAQLEMQTAHLEEQTAELELLNDELQERSRTLEAALGARSRFYAAMSHELRTPINAIIGYNALILEGIYGPLPEPQANALRRAQRAAKHLLELVNDVLDLAKIEAGRIELQLEPTGFPSLLEELADTVRSLADQHGSEVVVTGPDAEHSIRTDPRRVRQILLNLLSNAIKFGEGNPVQLAWRPTPAGGVEIAVRDRGRGISAAHIERIFEEFEQVEPASPGGTGLGLPISRRLAAVLGGEITAQSVEGEGSTFTLYLPAEPPPAPSPTDPVDV